MATEYAVVGGEENSKYIWMNNLKFPKPPNSKLAIPFVYQNPLRRNTFTLKWILILDRLKHGGIYMMDHTALYRGVLRTTRLIQQLKLACVLNTTIA